MTVRRFKRPYVLAIVSFLMIPAVTVLAGRLINSINPEIAAGDSNYERNYWLLSLAKHLSILAVLLVIIGLWFLTCLFLVKSKKRSYGWLPLAMLGPFGLIILTMLSDNAPAPGDLYQQFVGKLKTYLRIAYELGFFAVVWVGAYQTMVLKRDLMIMYEAAATRNFHGANYQSTNRLQRYVGFQREFGSLGSGGSLLFAVADLF